MHMKISTIKNYFIDFFFLLVLLLLRQKLLLSLCGVFPFLIYLSRTNIFIDSISIQIVIARFEYILLHLHLK